MMRPKYGPAMSRWPRNPVAPDPETVRQRIRSAGPAGRPLI
jgi:hypothetical protein